MTYPYYTLRHEPWLQRPPALPSTVRLLDLLDLLDLANIFKSLRFVWLSNQHPLPPHPCSFVGLLLSSFARHHYTERKILKYIQLAKTNFTVLQNIYYQKILVEIYPKKLIIVLPEKVWCFHAPFGPLPNIWIPWNEGSEELQIVPVIVKLVVFTALPRTMLKISGAAAHLLHKYVGRVLCSE